jgi:hypothetical protein
MDAPIYGLGPTFEAPVAASYEHFTVETVSLAELMAAPDAWAIVLKHAPGLGMTVKSPQVQPYLTNMTADSFVKFGVVTLAQINAANSELGTLPRTKWPVQ